MWLNLSFALPLLNFFTSNPILGSGQMLRLRVVSYNVLSSHLASPGHFTTLNPEHLYASARLPVVLKKLSNEISKKNTIICLQEV